MSGLQLNLSGLGERDGRSSTHRDSPSPSKKSTSRMHTVEELKKTPRSNSCEAASLNTSRASPKRRKESALKRESNTPRLTPKHSSRTKMHQVTTTRRLAETGIGRRAVPAVNGTGFAHVGGSRTHRDEKSSTPRSARGVNPKTGRRTGARGQGELNEHEGRESRERAASLHGEEVVTRESSTGDEITEERRIVVADTTVDYASNVKELQYLHKCIEQTIQNCAPANTVLKILDECIMQTSGLLKAVSDLPEVAAMLERDTKDLCNIRQSAGNGHPDLNLILISLKRITAVAERLLPASPASSPLAAASPQSPSSSPPLQPFQLGGMRGEGKSSKDFMGGITMAGHGAALAGIVVSESPPSLIHMGAMAQQTSSQELYHEDDLCPQHFRKLRVDDAPDAPKLKEPRIRSSSDDLSDGSSDSEIRSMNLNLLAGHPTSRDTPDDPLDSPPPGGFDFLHELSRLTMEDGRHFANMGEDHGYPMDPAVLDAFTDHVPRGFSTEELAKIAENGYLELVQPCAKFESMQCQVCMRRLTAKPSRSNSGKEDSSDSEDGEPGQLLTKLPCCHVFHDSCIEKWFCFGRNCPICRAPVFPVEESQPQQTETSTGALAANSNAAPLEQPASQGPDQMQRMINPIEQAAVPTRRQEMIRVPALPLHFVNSPSEHSTPRTPSAPNSARLPMSPRSAFTDIKSHRSSATESDATPRSGLNSTPRSEPLTARSWLSSNNATPR